MILFDLRCADDHVFEAWFGSSAAYDRQHGDGHLICPICGSTAVEKAMMAPAIPTKGNRKAVLDPNAMKQAIGQLAAVQAKVLERSQWVGSSFARRARAMHHGDEPAATIHGQATLAEAKSLVDEGVQVASLPLPIVPPDQVN